MSRKIFHIVLKFRFSSTFNNKNYPIIKKINNKVIGIPIEFQQKLDILFYKNAPFNFSLLEFPSSGNFNYSNSKNSFSFTSSLSLLLKNSGLAKKV